MIGQAISHYRIVEKLGGGGMGVVYKAEASSRRTCSSPSADVKVLDFGLAKVFLLTPTWSEIIYRSECPSDKVLPRRESGGKSISQLGRFCSKTKILSVATALKEHLRWTVLMVMTVCIVPIAAAQNPPGSCWHATKSDFVAGVKGIPAGIESIPGGVVHGDYKWLLPVGLATGLLIGTHADQRASRHITSPSSEQTSRNLSNALTGVELGSAGLTYLVGCRAGGHSHARSTGFHALEAAGYALAADGILKAVFRREYPYTPGGDGRFWHGGGSFPSGHAATSFGFASAMAHEYPHTSG